ncbi:MAG: flagellar protein FlgN [Oscillospiraceae bacterium]|nr:flagellar protein FlgN [Oscillospiraceae bacterium]
MLNFYLVGKVIRLKFIITHTIYKTREDILGIATEVSFVEKHFSNLITVLGLQRDIYTKLHELSVEKREAIEKQDIKTLERVTKDEQPLMFMLTENERERKSMMAVFSEKLNIPADEVTIQDIVGICPQSFVAALKRTQVELTNIVQEQISINNINSKLIESRLEYISFMLDTAREDGTNAYNNAGAERKRIMRNSSTIDFGA